MRLDEEREMRPQTQTVCVCPDERNGLPSARTPTHHHPLFFFTIHFFLFLFGSFALGDIYLLEHVRFVSGAFVHMQIRCLHSVRVWNLSGECGSIAAPWLWNILNLKDTKILLIVIGFICSPGNYSQKVHNPLNA